ncbi:hypothetical protein [Paraclostridium bifermentans]|uniref:hypothetical protein n=1 Tax=Paraclostridium bifermentans TaxID=1490 RepID=UPI0021C43050|nr:hypothetical protein [Paraclostridium bifermentans]GKZ02503.1 hypothetical protein ANS014_09370 [Paraclostridium bifermentans]
MNAEVNNKDLIEIYKKTVHNIEKEVKRISFFNKFRLKKIIALQTRGTSIRKWARHTCT